MGKIKLFCLPYAGGTASIYNKWKNKIGNNIEIIPVELPGRGKLFDEKLKTHMNQMVDFTFHSIVNELDCESYAFFGYSMGSMIAYELIRKIERMGYCPPIHAFFSAKQAPHIERNDKKLHVLEENEFLEEIMKLGGTPKEVIENRELLDIFVNILKADYQVVETYKHYLMESKINCDITVLYGNRDKYLFEEIKEWEKLTNMSSDFFEFDGGHFFINDKLDRIIDIVNMALKNAEDSKNIAI